MDLIKLLTNSRFMERLRGLRGAMQFLTTLPAGKIEFFDASVMVAWFPVVGLDPGGYHGLL